MRFVAIDTETPTSFNDDLCELGIAIVDDDVIVETRDWLIKPYNNCYFHRNSEIHGINADDTKNSPSFDIVYSELLPYLLNCDVIVAHNAVFDMTVIKKTMLRFNLQMPNLKYICSRNVGRKAYCGLSHFDLATLCEINHIDMGIHHRADYDAVSCAKLFLCEMQKLSFSLEKMIDSFGLKWDDINVDGYIPSQPSIEKYALIKRGSVTNELLEEAAKVLCENANSELFGKKVCFTGNIGISKEEAVLMAARLGAHVQKNVDLKLDYLIVGDNPCGGESGKLKKAKCYNENNKASIKILDCDTFLKICKLLE